VKQAEQLKHLCSRYREAARACAEDIARRAAARAEELAPEGSGPRRGKRLKSSFSSFIEEEGERITGVARVENPHAAFVEFGTGRRGAATGAGGSYDPDWPGMAAQPYMQPAADEMREEFRRDMIRRMRKAGKDR